MQIGIIGGGAAGLFAAALAASKGLSVLLFEKGDRVGKKLLLTGAGRCNLSNIEADNRLHYHGSFDPSCLLSHYPQKQLIALFESFGLGVRMDQAGRFYPRSNQASSVLDALRLTALENGAVIKTDTAIQDIQKSGSGFILKDDRQHAYSCDKVFYCAGGKAAPSTGSDGRSFELLQKLGHHITALQPALTTLKTNASLLKGMEGMRLLGRVSCIVDGKIIASRDGEIQLTKNGSLSGICVMDLSGYYEEGHHTEISLNLISDLSKERFIQLLKSWPAAKDGNRLGGLINKRVGQILSAGTSDPEKLYTLLSDWRFPVLGLGSYADAQVTRGGVPGCELKSFLESKFVSGLFILGEAVDLYGDCGGFNLHFAFTSAAAAVSAVLAKGRAE